MCDTIDHPTLPSIPVYPRHIRDVYVHECGTMTKMGKRIAQTIAQQPGFYTEMFCIGCVEYRPRREFCWEDGTPLGR